MWGWTPAYASGYCGSVSLQTAAIYYGNYLTEDAVRGTSGGHDGNHSLVIVYRKDLDCRHGASYADCQYPMSATCRKLKLNCSMYNYDREKAPQHESFLRWAKGHIDDAVPVIMGLYWASESDPDYDHM